MMDAIYQQHSPVSSKKAATLRTDPYAAEINNFSKALAKQILLSLIKLIINGTSKTLLLLSEGPIE